MVWFFGRNNLWHRGVVLSFGIVGSLCFVIILAYAILETSFGGVVGSTKRLDIGSHIVKTFLVTITKICCIGSNMKIY
jgi:hypothetical protein